MSWLPIVLWALWMLAAPTVRGERAFHSLWLISKPEGPLNADGSATAFAHVQEKGEFRLHKLIGIAAGVPFALIVAPLFVVLPLQLLAMILADGLSRKIEAIDYAGHGAEIMAAEAARVIGYREAEIARMSDDRDKQGDDIAAELDRWRWLACVVFWLGRAP